MKSHWFTAILCIAGLLSASPVALYAQEVTASITGKVTDSSGGVVPGTKITAINTRTNESREAIAGNSGDYAIPLLKPGSYKLVSEKAGFKSSSRDGIVLEVNQRALIDITLAVGDVTERVDVTAEVAAINTENYTVGKVIDGASISNMPMNGRVNITGLMALAPGIQNPGNQDTLQNTGIVPTVAGASGQQAVEFTLDGVSNAIPNGERGLAEWPPLDGIQEFKVITSGAGAEFNKPNQVIVISKSGSNQFHGAALFYNRNRLLAAKNFFATGLDKPKYNRNEFGGNFSGPVLLPHVYSGKDRTFFFFNYEGFRRRQAQTRTAQVPTATMRQGDFTGLATITDPLTNTPFPNNRIPADRLNPVTQRLGQLYPLPNTTGSGPAGTGLNLVENLPIPEYVDRWSTRVDHNISPRDQIFGSLMVGHLGPNPSNGPVSTFGGMRAIGEHNTNSSFTWNHSFGPSLINEMRLGYLNVIIYRTPQNADLDIAGIIPGLGAQGIAGAPQLTITNIQAMSEAGSSDVNRVGTVADNLSWIHGSHVVKTGFQFMYLRHTNIAATPPERGAYSFTGRYAGIAYADFVLGYPATTQRPTPTARQVRDEATRYGIYLQDDWKVTRRLTVNLGLRYDYDPQEADLNGRAAMFIPSLRNVVVFGPAYPSGTQQRVVDALGIKLSKDAGLPEQLFDYVGQDKNNFAPRVGLAYRMGASTVLRSGFGVYYNVVGIGRSFALAANLPFVITESFEQPSSKTPVITMNNPFPGQGSLPTNPTAAFQPKIINPYTLQWNLTLERQLPRDIGLRVGYYGQRNVKQHGSYDVNAVGPAPGPVQARRPYQPFSSISAANVGMYQSTTNQLQAGVQKRYSAGLLVSAEYQYVRAIGTESFQNPANWSDSRGNLNNIRKHVLVGSYVYDLPFGKGRRLLNGASGVVDRIASGWQLTGIIQAMSGSPFSPAFTTSVQGSVGGRPNVVPGVPLYPANRTLTQYFNPAAFAAPPDFTYGNAGYNILWGPGAQSWDAGLAKNSQIRERLNLQIKIDAFSVLNHPMFANPAASISNASTVGRISSSTGERTIQLGAKLMF